MIELHVETTKWRASVRAIMAERNLHALEFINAMVLELWNYVRGITPVVTGNLKMHWKPLFTTSIGSPGFVENRGVFYAPYVDAKRNMVGRTVEAAPEIAEQMLSRLRGS